MEKKVAGTMRKETQAGFKGGDGDEEEEEEEEEKEEEEEEEEKEERYGRRSRGLLEATPVERRTDKLDRQTKKAR